MWKRDEAVRPMGAGAAGDQEGRATGGSTTARRPGGESSRLMERDVANIGKSMVIKGELNGSEDLTIEGQVEGRIELRQHVLTIGPNGKIKAQVFAKAVIVFGELTGKITSTDKVNIRENGSVDGDIISPRVAIAEGAHFRGSIDMQQSPEAQSAQAPKAAANVRPAAKPAPAPAPVGRHPVS